MYINFFYFKNQTKNKTLSLQNGIANRFKGKV